MVFPGMPISLCQLTNSTCRDLPLSKHCLPQSHVFMLANEAHLKSVDTCLCPCPLQSYISVLANEVHPPLVSVP